MKKYVICVNNGADRNAATKARQDAEQILLSHGHEAILFQGERTAAGSVCKQVNLIYQTISSWVKMTKEVEPGSQIVMQYPFFPIKAVYLLRWLLPKVQKQKNIRFYALIHDLNSLRGLYGKTAVYSDKHFLKLFDHIISHNSQMAAFLQNKGIPAEKLTELTVFDYLTDAIPQEHHIRDGITIAGNLDMNKSGYLLSLAQSVSLPIHLYGKGLDEDKLAINIQYHGSFHPNELPGKLEGGFGLVWDGQSSNGCEGPTGTYLRYNNPHKLSLYLAAGMPVIIWKEAAEAAFVKENGVGLLIDDLTQIDELVREVAEEQYKQMIKQAQLIGQKVREGYYLSSVLEKVAQEAMR